MNKIGSRLQVMRGTAKQTSGGLSKKDLQYNKYGKIVSKMKSNLSKRNYIGGRNNISSSVTAPNTSGQELTGNILAKQAKQAALAVGEAGITTIHEGTQTYTQLVTTTGETIRTAAKMTGTVAKIANDSLEAATPGITTSVGHLSSTMGSAAGVVNSTAKIIAMAAGVVENKTMAAREQKQLKQQTRIQQTKRNEEQKQMNATHKFKKNKLLAEITSQKELNNIRSANELSKSLQNSNTVQLNALNKHIIFITSKLENEIADIHRAWYNKRGLTKLNNIKNILNTFKSFVILLINNSDIKSDVRDTIVIGYCNRINVWLMLIPAAKQKLSGGLRRIYNQIQNEYNSMVELYNKRYYTNLDTTSLLETENNSVSTKL